MSQSVYEKRGETRRCVDRIVNGEFRQRQHLAPRTWIACAEASKDIFDYAIDALGLTVGLGMVLRRHVQASTEHSEQALPKGTREPCVAVRHDGVGQPMLYKHMLDEKLGRAFCVGRFFDRSKVNHLA
jgi:hypothetical protein